MQKKLRLKITISRVGVMVRIGCRNDVSATGFKDDFLCFEGR